MLVMHELVRKKIDSMMHWAFVEGYNASVKGDIVDRAWLHFREEMWQEEVSDRLCYVNDSMPITHPPTHWSSDPAHHMDSRTHTHTPPPPPTYS